MCYRWPTRHLHVWCPHGSALKLHCLQPFRSCVSWACFKTAVKKPLSSFSAALLAGQQGVDLTKFVRTGKRQITTFFEADNVGQMEKIRIGLADQGAASMHSAHVYLQFACMHSCIQLVIATLLSFSCPNGGHAALRCPAEGECSVLLSTVEIVNQSSRDSATFACSEVRQS